MPAKIEGIDLSGQVAVVTGAGRGVGVSIAKSLARAGACLGLLARSKDELEAVAAEIRVQGGRAVAVPTDLSDRHATEGALAEVVETLGPVDLLVNNAARADVIGPIWETDPDEWWTAAATNLLGPYVLARGVIPSMIERRGGRIINLSSFPVMRHLTSYLCPKAALIRFTELLDLEVRHLGIRVFAMGPGTVNTQMWRTAADGELGRRWLPELQTFTPDMFSPPEHAAEHALFFASGRGDVLSGREFVISDDLDLAVREAETLARDELQVMRIRRIDGSATKVVSEHGPS